jgi:hypothetical protein
MYATSDLQLTALFVLRGDQPPLRTAQDCILPAHGHICHTSSATCAGGDFFNVTGLVPSLHYMARASSSWQEASQLCQERDMELASLFSTAQAAEVHRGVEAALRTSMGSYWVGANALAVPGVYLWDAASWTTPPFLPYAPGKPVQPQGPCGFVTSAADNSDGGLDLSSCDVKRPALCTKPSKCTQCLV